MLRYYGDPEVLQFAERHQWALLFPFHCPAKSFTAPGEQGDINPDPRRGQGRALVAALDQFAGLSKHPELGTAKLVLLGFSGAGTLVARFPDYAPQRVVAVIAANAGHFDPFGLDTVALSESGRDIPQLIIAGGDDAVSGVSRPYEYFRRHFDQGTYWTFLVQNQTPHCCAINVKPLVLEWLEATAIEGVDPRSGWYGFITRANSTTADCRHDGHADPVWCRGGIDHWGGQNWTVVTATVSRQRAVRSGMMAAGWMPTAAFATHWRDFVTQRSHPVMSLP
jgi:hypothetical protein